MGKEDEQNMRKTRDHMKKQKEFPGFFTTFSLLEWKNKKRFKRKKGKGKKKFLYSF